MWGVERERRDAMQGAAGSESFRGVWESSRLDAATARARAALLLRQNRPKEQQAGGTMTPAAEAAGFSGLKTGAGQHLVVDTAAVKTSIRCTTVAMAALLASEGDGSSQAGQAQSYIVRLGKEEAAFCKG